jgi:hypothetical protein
VTKRPAITEVPARLKAPVKKSMPVKFCIKNPLLAVDSSPAELSML